MTIFNTFIDDIVSRITSKVFSKESILKERSMMEIHVADCGRVAGGPQVQNETSD